MVATAGISSRRDGNIWTEGTAMTTSSSPPSRIGGAAEHPDDPLLADMFAQIRASRGHLLNIHRVGGLAPKLLRAQATYTRAMREDAAVPRDLQELIILRVAQVNGSDYEQSVHRPIALACGVSQPKIDALAAWQQSSLYSARERAALGFAEQAGSGGEVDDAVFTTLRQVFSVQEIVELAAIVSWYVGNSRFVRALRIVSEAERA
jgi:4-carboxymuconolactone decarboxylase